jgi:fumarate hydratase subunit alpha
MRIISTEIISGEVRDLFLTTAFVLHEKVSADLKKALALEPSEQGQKVLSRLIENSEISAKTFIPLCQDTGLPQIFIEIGQKILLDGMNLTEAVETGVKQAYETSFLRESGCLPISRESIVGTLPMSLETSIVPGDKLTIYTLSKGGGCDNRSKLINLHPTASWDEIKKNIIEIVVSAGPDACPPFYLGITIGGTFESAPRIAKRALMELFYDQNKTEMEKSLSADLLKDINATGLGPMGYGGRTTALGLNLKIYPTHIASLPVAVNLNCHSFRIGKITL